ncbi:hypothetical protein N8987_00130 [Crocinitomix sp.]|nr:hypothetical protein [Crocinitomix sp.]
MKIKLHQLLILVTLFVFATSCKKKEIQYQFEGLVKSSVDNSAISGAQISLSQKTVSNGSSSADYSQAASTSTGSDGSYSITILREMVTSFLFEFEKDNYFDLSVVETSAKYTTDGVNTLNVQMEPKSWIEFKIENTASEETDHFKLITQTFREDCLGCAENRTYDFYGALDTTITYVTTGGKYVKFTYVDVTNAISATDSLYATPFETEIYSISY